MSTLHHVNTVICPLCEEKLKRVHPDLRRWVSLLRSGNLDAHVAWGYRGEADQEEAFRTGHSNAHYGESPHNTVPARAVDLFRLTQAGGAAFDAPWYRDVIAPIARASGLVWGGDFTHLKDLPHVEMPAWTKP